MTVYEAGFYALLLTTQQFLIKGRGAAAAAAHKLTSAMTIMCL